MRMMEVVHCNVVMVYSFSIFAQKYKLINRASPRPRRIPAEGNINTSRLAELSPRITVVTLGFRVEIVLPYMRIGHLRC